MDDNRRYNDQVRAGQGYSDRGYTDQGYPNQGYAGQGHADSRRRPAPRGDRSYTSRDDWEAEVKRRHELEERGGFEAAQHRATSATRAAAYPAANPYAAASAHAAAPTHAAAANSHAAGSHAAGSHAAAATVAPASDGNARMVGIAIAVVLFGFIAVMMVLGLVAPDKDFSDEENRSLATWPEFSMATLLDGSYTSDLQSYVADQFFGRNGWISLRLSEEKAEGMKESNGVYLGNDGYLIEKATEPDMDHVDRNLEAIDAFAQHYSNLTINMAIIPNAVCVMSNYLPKNAPARDQRADLSMLQSKLVDNVHFLDVTDALTIHRDEGLYYRTDHHWTSLGAYYAFLTMAPSLGITSPITSYDIYTVCDDFEGTMASKCGSHAVKDSVQVYSPKDSGVDYYVTYENTHEKSCSLYSSAALSNKDKYTVFFGGNYPQITIKTTNNNGRCLLIFKDSYANSFVQFLTPYYAEIILIDPRYYYDNAATVITNEGVTDVLFLYNLNTYLGDTSLGDCLDTATNSQAGGTGDAAALGGEGEGA